MHLRIAVCACTLPVLSFVRALPEATSTAVTRVREVTKVSFLKVFVVAELMHERTLTQQTHYHLI